MMFTLYFGGSVFLPKDILCIRFFSSVPQFPIIRLLTPSARPDLSLIAIIWTSLVSCCFLSSYYFFSYTKIGQLWIGLLSAKLEKDKAGKHKENNTAFNWRGFESLLYYSTAVLEAHFM